MRVLVVGQGGREHAIAWKLRQSPLVKEIYAAPGNAGIAQVADCVNIGVADIIELADFAEKLKIDLTVVGPELPLTLGIVDEFQKRGLPIFGPTRLASELEGSKVFSKEFMKKYAIPTAEGVLSGEAAATIMKTIILPTIQGMATEGRPYTGCLYAGLMLTPNGPKVLEYNCRFGDPETQVQMLRLEDDLADVMLKVARGNLGDMKLNWKKEGAACVVVAVDGYPDDFPKGQEVAIDRIDDEAVVLFHAGTIKKGAKMVNVAGRVLSVCARSTTLVDALRKACEAEPT